MPRAHAGVGRIIARPTAILDSYRAEDEEVLYDDAPSFNAFLIDQLPGLLVVVLAAGLVIVWALNGGSTFVTGLVLIALGVFTFYLWVQRFRQLYTRYVLTSFRVLRIRGILSVRTPGSRGVVSPTCAISRACSAGCSATPRCRSTPPTSSPA